MFVALIVIHWLTLIRVFADTAGQDDYDEMLDSYVKMADVVFIGFEVTSHPSFLETERFLNHVRRVPEQDLTVFAVGNKIDSERVVSEKEAREHFASMKPPIPYFETSAKTGEGVNKVFEEAIRMGLLKRSHCNENNYVEEEGEEDPSKCMIN